MFRLFSVFSNGKIKSALRRDGVIVDVRNVHEYDQGRVRGSIHIPIDRISVSIERIRQMNKPIVVCATGDSRSSEAVRILKQNGIKEVYNGGSWERVLRLLNNIH
jgi:phage shock protein E